MSQVRLSVVIATFNRGSLISETLDTMLGQLTDDVEIVVLDGGSSDSTQSVMRRYAEQHPQLRYFRQDTNRGVDQDFDRAVGLANGSYCWLMSDDDLLKPGAVAAVLEALRSEPSLVIVNADVRNGDFSEVLEPRRLRVDSDRVYAPERMSEFFADTGRYLTFIGCVVIRRDIWLARDRERYFGSLFIHVGVIFSDRLPGSIVVIATPFISIRYGVAMWRPKEFEVWMFKWPQLVWSLPAAFDDAKASLCQPEPWRELDRLVFFRAKGSYSLAEYRRWIKPRMGFTWKRVAALAIAATPGVLLNTAVLFYLRALYRGPGKKLALLDTRNSRYSVWKRRLPSA